jgi:hypothetical protein
MRREPQLSAAFRKDPEAELFLDRLNAILAPHQEQDYQDLPERYPTLHIIGAPRSGTTLLTQLIAAHLEVGSINHLIAAFWRAPVFGIRLSQKLLGGSPASSYASQYGRTPGIQEPHEFGYFWSAMLNYDDMCERGRDHEERIDWERLKTVLTNMTHAFQAPVMFKSMLLAWHMERIYEVLPRTCFVRIRREPVENALSILQARQEYGGSLDQWISLKPSECGRLENEPCWTQAVAQVYYLEQSMTKQLQRLPNNNVLEVRYDELCDDPRAVLQRVEELLAAQGTRVAMRSDPPQSFKKSQRLRSEDELKGRVREVAERFYRSASHAA